MEKFYRIKSDSSLFKSYFSWLEASSLMCSRYVSFANSNGIEAKEFVPSKESYAIVPTVKDLQNFGSQMTSKTYAYNVRYFKKNSEIGKKWAAFAKDIEIVHKPMPGHYVDYLGNTSSRLFDHNGDLYCSIQYDDSSYSFNAPENTFEEIKGSAFWEALEEEEAKDNA